ncbi:TlpA family protein disulfide reductase [Parasulfuritortus cantonensis]|uniref:TlpA family protein disulfide reductase n=1 Tax=Parasulfuritortus cantonensis TaxID=2528202 RepID=A0A4R1B7J1_9PROT|nr:TlpA disulfide reductase family protein [Parasulfuritortus cantonensis]TCJ11629.1 TlpA family protein disulfide reductase [Parasulfuritortus cantonensis]
MFRTLLALFAALLLAACGDGNAPKLNTGMPAPAFATVRLDGSPVRYPDDFKGKPVVIRFWADWCPYCEGEMQDIDKVYPPLHAKGLEVLAVNVGQDHATASAFITRLAIHYPALLDEQAEITRRYGVIGLPTTYFVGADGVIKAKAVGEADAATFSRLAGALLQ